jgi:phosphohistidine phosphatase
MQIYILRHGIAEDAAPGGSDADRALTREGETKLRHVLQCAHAAGVRPSVIMTSPLKRAMETAELAASILNVKRDLTKTSALAPANSPQRVWSEVRAHPAEALLIAGHEPLLSRVAAFLLRCPSLRLDLKKGAIVRIDIEKVEPEPHGTLKWILTPKLAQR